MSWSADDLLALVASVLAERQTENGTPGVGYGVVADGEIRSGGSGVSALDGPPVTGSTLFRLCSITKPMTSTLVMSLVEDGLLELDEPVVRRLPDLALAGAAAREALTLRHLLLHTSGLEGEWRGDLATYGDGDDALAALIGDYGRLAQYAPAGAFWGYCNTGYWLAGHLAATAAGTSYEQALRDRVLVPLGMHDTVLSAEEAKPDRLAVPHSVRDGQAVPYPPYDFPRARVSSGGVISSADDLLKFAAFHLGVERPGASSPLPAHRIAELREPAVAAGPGEAQSLGWATLTGPGPLCIGHSGSYGGFATRLLLVPEAGIGVVVLTNADPGGALAVAVRDAVREQVLGIDLPQRHDGSVSETELQRLTGEYAHPSVDRSRVYVDGGRLAVQMKGPKRDGIGWCTSYSPLEFVIAEGDFVGTEIQFLAGPDGQVDNIRVGQRLGARLS